MVRKHAATGVIFFLNLSSKYTKWHHPLSILLVRKTMCYPVGGTVGLTTTDAPRSM